MKIADATFTASALRQRAEAALAAESGEAAREPELSPDEARKVVHELRTHQIELEMQNEELRRAQLDLVAARDRFSDLYDFAPVGYVTVSGKGLVVEANLTFAEMLGHARGRLICQPFSAFILSADEDLYYLHRRKLLATRERQVCEVRMERNGGAWFWVEIESVVVAREEGDGLRFRSAISDVTARKQAEKERWQLHDALCQALENAQLMAEKAESANRALAAEDQELEAKNAELERYAYTVSHDLKSPLLTIRGFLGILAQDLEAGDAGRVASDIARIDAAACKMAQLLEELLELSRIGRVVKPPEVADFGELASEAVDQVAGAIAERGVAVEIAPELPPVYGDRRRLAEVLQNLIENAVKFMGDQPRPRITVGCRNHGGEHHAGERDHGELVFYVRDNGIGVDPRYHETIYGLFDRLDPSIAGSGIGLALVRRIVELHDGRLWIESDGPGTGSTFCFTLPQQPPAVSGEDLGGGEAEPHPGNGFSADP